MKRFTDEERAALLAVKGVGPTVVMRLEELGLGNFPALAGRQAEGICREVSASLGTTCWANSPIARAAIAAAIERAKEGIGAAAH